METILEIKNLSKSFTLKNQGDKVIHGCKDISFNLKKGEFIGITGKSGSGKSTILKSIYRTYYPDRGDIFYNSKLFGRINLSAASEREMIAIRKYEMGYVTQFLKVMPRITARQVVEDAVLEIGGNREQAHEEAINILSHFELPKKLWDTYPNTFSGGEKLRLNIAHAMVKKPIFLLLDEPTASLDSHSKSLVRELIEQLKAEGTTMLGIFHDIDFMRHLVDNEFSMQQGLRAS